jgi:hypothetical protein
VNNHYVATNISRGSSKVDRYSTITPIFFINTIQWYKHPLLFTIIVVYTTDLMQYFCFLYWVWPSTLWCSTLYSRCIMNIWQVRIQTDANKIYYNKMYFYKILHFSIYTVSCRKICRCLVWCIHYYYSSVNASLCHTLEPGVHPLSCITGGPAPIPLSSP